MKKIISLFAILVILTNSMSVNASSQNYYFDYVIGGNNIGHWVNNDPAMPDDGNYFFYVENGMVFYIPEIKAIPLILNKGIGLTMKPEILAVFITNYLTDRVITSPISAVYNSSESVGITCDDLQDLPVIGTTINIPEKQEIKLPSSYVNNVYNYYNEWVQENDYDLPDYINVETRNRDFYSNKFNLNDAYTPAQRSFLNTNDFAVLPFAYNSSTMTYKAFNSYWGDYYSGSANDCYVVSESSTGYENLCNLHRLTMNDNTLNFVDMMLATTDLRISCQLYDEAIKLQTAKRVTFSTDGTYTVVDSPVNGIFICASNDLPCSDVPYLTVYKNKSILSQFFNETYAPITFVNQDFTSFSTDNDNTVTTNITEVDNSSSVNETVYNETSESFTEYYTENNYHVDNSVVITNNTEIFNTYYGDSSGGGDDNGGGDNGGGGEIIVPDYDFGYLKVITDILAEFLKGVQDLNEMIIDTIHSITLAFGGITTLYESVFGWLPDPILGLMIIGLGLALLGSFITWFR